MGTVNKSFIIIGLFLLQSCGEAYDKAYYERISKIQIPETASVVETIDNGEFMTVTTFNISTSDMRELQSKYKFEPVDGSFISGFLGNNILKGPKPETSDLNNCLMKFHQEGKANAVYVMDTSRRLLWAEINYPDWGGN